MQKREQTNKRTKEYKGTHVLYPKQFQFQNLATQKNPYIF